MYSYRKQLSKAYLAEIRHLDKPVQPSYTLAM